MPDDNFIGPRKPGTDWRDVLNLHIREAAGRPKSWTIDLSDTPFDGIYRKGGGGTSLKPITPDTPDLILFATDAGVEFITPMETIGNRR